MNQKVEVHTYRPLVVQEPAPTKRFSNYRRGGHQESEYDSS